MTRKVENKLRHAGLLAIWHAANLQQAIEGGRYIEHQGAQGFAHALANEQIKVQLAIDRVGIDGAQANKALLTHERGGIAGGDGWIGRSSRPITGFQ